MIIVTGGAGFIGSNLVHYFSVKNQEKLVVVDDLTDGKKFVNLADSTIADYLDQDHFLALIKEDHVFAEPITAIFHQGACSATTEWNGKYMMENNYQYSKVLLNYCQRHKIPFIYASSAAVYGGSMEFAEDPANEKPLNVYGYSKLLFDQYVRQILPTATAQIVGLRYFNVYGPREAHKGSMASVAYHLHQQLLEGDAVKLFKGSDGYANGEQRRDFIYVDDVVKVNTWLFEHPAVSGIFNVGTGHSQPFNDVANAVIAWHKRGDIDYIDFPQHLVGCYQSYTEASMQALIDAGYDQAFCSVEEGVKLYLDWLKAD